MYYVGVCDDGINICSFFEGVIKRYGQRNNLSLNVETWNSGEALKEFLVLGNQLDILFLDIELFELGGIELGKYIRNQLENHNMQIIYISGKSAYALSLFQVQPMDFLVKPITDTQIEQALSLAIKLTASKDGRFKCRIGKEYCYIPYRNIMYFVSEGRMVKVVCFENYGGQAADKDFEFYGKLKNIRRNLSLEFLQIHQSYIVNTSFVLRYRYEQVELTDGTIIPISKSYRKPVRTKMLCEE